MKVTFMSWAPVFAVLCLSHISRPSCYVLFVRHEVQKAQVWFDFETILWKPELLHEDLGVLQPGVWVLSWLLCWYCATSHYTLLPRSLSCQVFCVFESVPRLPMLSSILGRGMAAHYQLTVLMVTGLWPCQTIPPFPPTPSLPAQLSETQNQLAGDFLKNF